MRLALVALLTIPLVACGTEPTPTPAPPCPTAPPSAVEAQAHLENAANATVTVSGAVEGEFTFELYGQEAPIAAANFVALARCGFYDGIKFHRVLSGFVIQAGDPQTKEHEGDFRGIGSGGAGYEYEIEPPADGLAYDQYSVSVANNRETNDSQFFIALEDLDQGLARNYTIFGQVTSGAEVVDAIGQVPVNDPRVGVPLTPVTIESIEIAAAEAEG